MIKEQLFKKEYAKDLLQIAIGDLRSAEILCASVKDGGRPENICFHAEQSIEKLLKAVLCQTGKPVPFTHSIELLLDRLGQSYQPPLADHLVSLTDYAAIRRYQEGNEIITHEDLKATIGAANDVLAWAKNIIV